MANAVRLRSSFAVRSLLLGVASLGLAPCVGALPTEYSGAEIRGWVVDEETKKPLEGVHVVGQWILQTGVMHGEHVVRLQVLEAVTDSTGQYYLPEWGPKPRPPRSQLEWGSDPILVFFRPGYLPWVRHNYDPPPANEAEMSQRISVWNGQTVALKPFRGTPERWASLLGGLQSGLGWGQSTHGPGSAVNDYWKQMPRMVLAIVEQRNLVPGPVRYRVQDPEAWHLTEAQLRALLREGGPTR